MIQMQAKRINDLEKDHKRDSEVIDVLKEALRLVSKEVQKEPAASEATRSDDTADDNDGETEAAKPNQKSKATKQSTEPQSTKWYNRPIGELFSR